MSEPLLFNLAGVRRNALCSDNVSGGDDFGMPIHAGELRGILNNESIEASASTATHLQLEVGPSFDPYGTFTQAADFELSLITVQ